MGFPRRPRWSGCVWAMIKSTLFVVAEYFLSCVQSFKNQVTEETFRIPVPYLGTFAHSCNDLSFLLHFDLWGGASILPFDAL